MGGGIKPHLYHSFCCADKHTGEWLLLLLNKLLLLEFLNELRLEVYEKKYEPLLSTFFHLNKSLTFAILGMRVILSVFCQYFYAVVITLVLVGHRAKQRDFGTLNVVDELSTLRRFRIARFAGK